MTVIAKKLKTGTACNTSIAGIMIRSAWRFLAANVPTINENNTENNNAMNNLSTVRNA